MFVGLIKAGLLVATLVAAPVLAAGQTNFASFTSLPGGTIAWENGLGYGAGAADGALFTAFAPGPLNPALVAAVPISFTWTAAGIVNSAATFQFRAFAANAPAQVTGPTFQVLQPSIAGSFSLDGPLGQPWLVGTFNNGRIITNLGFQTALFNVNSFPGGLVITSGTFQPLLPGGFFFNLQKSGIPLPGIQVVAGQSISSFDPAFSGVFAGPGVPEPASWAMLIAGFAGIGLSARARRAAGVVQNR